jgi:DNA polymerase III subunit gamma/tau
MADLASEWRRVMNALKVTMRAFVREAEPRFEEDRVVLLFPEGKEFHYQKALNSQEEIAKAVREVLGIEQVELRLGKKKLTDEPAARPFSPGKPAPAVATNKVAPVVPASRAYPRASTTTTP